MTHPLDSTSPEKAGLRSAALAARDALSAERRMAAALAVAARTFPVNIPRGIVVSGYWPVRSEIDPAPLMQSLAAQGAQLALPVISGRDQPLVFRTWTAETELLRGQIGIMEPSPQSPEVVPDILLVPLAAFDRSGHRIGYGAGHYDRTLAQLRQSKAVIVIGIAFAAQEISAVPADAHDARLDLVLTENETIDFRSS